MKADPYATLHQGDVLAACGLILSVFPGIDLLGRAFEEEGFCVVRGPDLLWGGDIHSFHPPAGKFDGVIGGPPCQRWAQSRNLAGDRMEQLNLIPEFERVVYETAPLWFVMENVTGAPKPEVAGYEVQSCILQDFEVGGLQLRRRRFSLGTRAGHLFCPPAGTKAPRGILTRAAKAGVSCLVLPTLCATNSTQRMRSGFRAWRNEQGKTSFTWADYLKGFGLPQDFDLPPFRQQAKFSALGNAVPLPMGRAIARAVKQATLPDMPLAGRKEEKDA